MAQIRIHNGTLIDGTGRAPIPKAALLIEDERIVAVGAAADLPSPEGPVQEIDAQGGSILPGFIDCHVHLMLEDFQLMNWIHEAFSLRFFKAAERMRRTLDAGITSVRDAGGADLGVKQAIEQGHVVGPRLQISTAILTITGGHVDWWLHSGADIPFLIAYPGFPDGKCDGVEDVRKKVREVLRAGAEVIKVCSTGGVLSPTDHPDFTQFSPDELRVMVEEGAARRGVKVMAHAQGTQGIKNAVGAGVHSIEHGIFLDDSAIEMMLERGTFLVPTLLAPVSVLAQEKLPDYVRQKAEAVAEAHKASISAAYRAGVKIAMGTDAGVMRHGTNLQELHLMTECGLSNMEAIVATTQTAAACLGWQDKVGTLEAGKLADVVISSSDPLADIRSLEDTDNIKLVLKGGVRVKDLRYDTVQK